MRRQPTLIDIPGILLRAILGTLARILLLAGGLLLLGSLFLMTWPSARRGKSQSLTDLATAAIQTYREFK